MLQTDRHETPTIRTEIYNQIIPACLASELPESAGEFTPNEHYNYFWRVKCKSEPEGKQGQIRKNQTDVPTTTLPPPLTHPTPAQGNLTFATFEVIICKSIGTLTPIAHTLANF